MHKYWVQFTALIEDADLDGTDAQVEGEMGINRDTAISEFQHIPVVARAVAEAFCKQNELNPHKVKLRIKAWQKFEEASVLVVPRMPS